MVELTLNRLEGTQLRALGLMSVFGFNMTYVVKGPTDEPGPKSCSIIKCRLLGHCYAKHDYKEFYCDCFEGYSGADCGVGPLCLKTPNMCKYGGTCGAPEATGARTVWLRVWAERRDAGALRTALARLVAMRTRTDRLRLLPFTLHFDMQPALSLHWLSCSGGTESCKVKMIIYSMYGHLLPVL